MGVAERNAQLTVDLATAREHALQLQERAEAVEHALEERDANAEAEQLLRHRVNLHDLFWLPLLEEELRLLAQAEQLLRHCLGSYQSAQSAGALKRPPAHKTYASICLRKRSYLAPATAGHVAVSVTVLTLRVHGKGACCEMCPVSWAFCTTQCPQCTHLSAHTWYAERADNGGAGGCSGAAAGSAG